MSEFEGWVWPLMDVGSNIHKIQLRDYSIVSTRFLANSMTHFFIIRYRSELPNVWSSFLIWKETAVPSSDPPGSYQFPISSPFLSSPCATYNDNLLWVLVFRSINRSDRLLPRRRICHRNIRHFGPIYSIFGYLSPEYAWNFHRRRASRTRRAASYAAQPDVC